MPAAESAGQLPGGTDAFTRFDALVSATDRHTPSYSRNVGVAETDATSIAFIDDDDVIGDGWVAAIGSALREHQLVGSRFEYHALNEPTVAAIGRRREIEDAVATEVERGVVRERNALGTVPGVAQRLSDLIRPQVDHTVVSVGPYIFQSASTRSRSVSMRCTRLGPACLKSKFEGSLSGSFDRAFGHGLDKACAVFG